MTESFQDANSQLPNPTPRPPGEEQRLLDIWATPTGWRAPTAINNSVIGIYYLGAAFMFFCLAGVLALIMRTQLALPDNDIVSQDLYNQLFTVHGTTMMFLFAVPAVEALGVLLIPPMLGARDLPFPRLSAFAIWTYVIGGSVFFLTIFFDLSPKGGWFMYPPLTLMEYSPGDNADFWLLGIGFIEISAIAGAIDIIVGILRTRPPGMTLDKLPVFGWAMLIFAGMIVVAFPAVILATMMLEIERVFGWPFYTAASGGDSLLWQHLFWFFGHPEVYIIFLPAAGLVSMMIPTIAQQRLVGYRLIVVALIATGFLSFGLWVHHMFTTGLPNVSLAFFSAASMAVAIPSGIQIFSWIATLAKAPEKMKLTTPALFILGMFFIFALGGLTGVMVAMVPFDWQAHDSYFIVAHMHYVLIGGMVFPLFATFYYWMPMASKTMLSEKLGRISFWCMFFGFNVAFLPMHLTGMLGMPRRIWTYGEASGWGALNMISTVGAFLLGVGVLVFILDLIRHFRVDKNRQDNPWNAGTLEFLPRAVYSPRSIPHVTSLEPLWDQPNLSKDVAAGAYYLPDPTTGCRETLITSPIDAKPLYIIQLPGPGWAHVITAAMTASCFLLLTVKIVIPAIICACVGLAACLCWMWDLDKGHTSKPVNIGSNIHLPVYMTGPSSHGWWAMVVLQCVAAALYLAYVFSYLYIWTQSPEYWPTLEDMPGLHWPFISAIGFIALVFCLWRAKADLKEPGGLQIRAIVWLVLAIILAVCAVALDCYSQWQQGVSPVNSSYGALVYLNTILNSLLTFAVVIMSLFAIARLATRRLDSIRCGSLEHTQLLGFYLAGQALLGLMITHGFPRVLI